MKILNRILRERSAIRKILEVLAAACLVLLLAWPAATNQAYGAHSHSAQKNAHQISALKQKQLAWLNHHPWLMRMSQLDFNGVSGEMITNACWRLVKTFAPHPHEPDHVAGRNA